MAQIVSPLQGLEKGGQAKITIGKKNEPEHTEDQGGSTLSRYLLTKGLQIRQLGKHFTEDSQEPFCSRSKNEKKNTGDCG